MKALSILLVEDNRAIASQICEFLQGHNWQVDYADNGRHGVNLALDNLYDVVILDLNLPDIDGLEVCRIVKQDARTQMPVLMLTARDAYEDKAQGFNSGADDYLTKPFDLRELVLRCDVLSRRPVVLNQRNLQVGQLILQLDEQLVEVNNRSLKLTKTGFEILTELARAYPKALSKSLLTHHLWGSEPPASNPLKSHIYSLRKALEGAFGHNVLMTVSNIGYKLENIEAQQAEDP